MSFANHTRYAALDVPHTDRHGVEVLLAVVKATFAIGPGGTCELAAQRPVRVADVYLDPSRPESSVLFPGDLVETKRGADVVVVGSAVAAEPVTSMDVTVLAPGRTVRLRVFGERTYYRGAGGRVVVGDAAPFLDKPIVYEHAYGGASGDAIERRNPAGRGVHTDPDELIGQPAPGIVDPDHPIEDAADRPEPVGLLAIASHWLPRAGYYGTAGEAWERERLPLVPLDFDERFFNCAHPSLQLDAPLRAGDALSVDGMRLGGPLALALPNAAIVATARYDDGRRLELRPPVDTLVVHVQAEKIELASRICLPLGRGSRRLREVRVEETNREHP